ncbi:MAG: HAMP domain-containing histidine kinase [Bacteroidia bacterium]
MSNSSILSKIYRIGLRASDSPQEERRIVMINKVTLFFLTLGAPVVGYILYEPNLPLYIDYYIVALWLSYFAPLFFSAKRWYNAAGHFLYFGGLLATSTATIIVGNESHIHYLILLVSGLPFVFFGREWKNRRLAIALLSLPVWIGIEVWCYYNEPLVILEDWQLYSIGVLYSIGILLFSLFISYNFTKAAEKFGGKIKRQRDALTEKNARLEQYSYLATHDLKTPLANIEGFVTLLEMDLEDADEEVQDSIIGIKKSVDQSRKTITELIEMASQDTSNRELVRVRLEPILKEVLFNLRNLINETDADVVSDFGESKEIRFSIAGVKSLLQNLLSNSLKYRHPDRAPEILINTIKKLDYVQLRVKDNGLGIDMEKDGDKLFSKFERIHTNAEGSGLGLSLIKSMVEESGGSIEVKSILGEGTEFIISFPVIK